MPELTTSQVFKRGTGFFDPEKHPVASATFVGIGGIGSFAATAVAKLGVPNITLIDPDIVEAHNAPNQFHPIVNSTESKVASLATEIERHIGTVPVAHQSRITDSGWETVGSRKLPSAFNGPVISGFDSMDARKLLWEQKIKFNPQVPLYIDGRIAGELILIYAFCPYDPAAVEKYEATLHSDDEAEPAVCTERGLIDVGFGIGMLVSRMVRMFYAGKDIDPITYMSVKSLSIQKGDWL